MNDLAIEVLNRGMQLIQENDKEKLQAQFEKLFREATEKAANETSRLSDIAPDVLTAYRKALTLDSGHPDGQNAYLSPLDQLITTEEAQPTTLYAEITSQAKVLAADLIRMAFDEALLGTSAPRHAVTLLRHFQEENLVELDELTFWLEGADGDWQTRLLSSKVGKIGGYDTDELEAIASDTNYDLHVRLSALQALIERTQQLLEDRERIVNLIRTFLTRPEAHEIATEETFTAFVICEALDLQTKELLPEIEAAFDEDRVDISVVTFDTIQSEWGIGTPVKKVRREDGLYLPLICKNCGREREHFVQQVLIDRGTMERQEAGEEVRYDPHIMDHEIICPKCGARDQYELGPLANMRLLMPTDGTDGFARLLSKKPEASGVRLHPRVQSFKSLVFGRPMHPLEGLERYKKLIEKEPENATHYLKMGNLFRTLYRYPWALETYRAGYELESKDAENVLAYAMAEHDFGDREKARTLYEEAQSMSSGRFLPKRSMMQTFQAATQGLRALQ